uniref:Photosystem I reaction center subunit VIII n=4 Tax=Epidendroideae TaxID=158332 RepID=D5HQ26_ONCHC|nr:photosystem I reaction center subunit VIII [Oncidium hybrid cultivar]ACT83119.1 photosystem I reaction center subunit VIII [Oncidium hybrid cultivar]
MIDLNFPSIFVPLVGLVFPAIAMASLFLYVQRNKIYKYDGIKSHQFLSTLDHHTDIFFSAIW